MNPIPRIKIEIIEKRDSLEPERDGFYAEIITTDDSWQEISIRRNVIFLNDPHYAPEYRELMMLGLMHKLIFPVLSVVGERYTMAPRLDLVAQDVKKFYEENTPEEKGKENNPVGQGESEA